MHHNREEQRLGHSDELTLGPSYYSETRPSFFLLVVLLHTSLLSSSSFILVVLCLAVLSRRLQPISLLSSYHPRDNYEADWADLVTAWVAGLRFI
jgi:hypothetical protein